MTEELRQLDVTPFDCGAMADGMEGRMTEREDTAQFVVMLRYLDLFARQMEIPAVIPQLNVCLKRNARYQSGYSGFYKSKKEIMKQLYENIMLGTGWSYGVCKMKGKLMDGLELFLPEYRDSLDWDKAVSMVPDILLLEQKGFQDIVITVCWNARVARYLTFAASNPREVESLFGEEAAMIRRILRKMADPYSVGSQMQCFKGNSYVMAYYEGRNDEITISSGDMDYNLYVQGMVLHLLLSRAEELFGLPRYRIGRGTAR